MTPQELEGRVRDMVADYLDIDAARLRPDARLGEDLCVDSLAAAEMIMLVEDATNITLPDDTIRTVTTYGDFVDAVVRASTTVHS